MFKNRKLVLLFVTVIALTITLSAISATDVNDTADAQSLEKTVTHEATTSNIEKTTQETNTSTKTKEITKKEQTNVKTATKTVTVNDYDELITEMNNAVNDTDNDNIIINLNEGTYKKFASSSGDSNIYFNPGNAQPNITLNGNQQHLTAGTVSQQFYLNNTCNVTINDLTFEHTVYNYANTMLDRVSFTVSPYSYSNLTLKNMNLNKGIYNYGTLIIGENVSYSDGFFIYGTGNVVTDDESKIIPYYYTYNGTYIIENMTFNSGKDNYGNLTLKNCTINAKITNYGNLTIYDDVIIGSSFDLINYGELNTNITDKMAPYLSFYNGNYSLENITISSKKTNNGTLTIKNSVINQIITNNGNLTLINDTFKSKRAPVNNAGGVIYLDNLTVNTPFTNEGTLIIGDNVTIGSSFLINGQGTIVTNKTNIARYMAYWNGNYTLENVTDTTTHTNEGYLTIINSTIKGNLQNYGTMHVINSTLNSSITSMAMGKPTGTFIFEDDVIFGSKFAITSSQYIIIMNDTSRITPYLTYFRGDNLLENYTISNSRTNYGNLTIHNSTLNYAFTNSGNLTLENSTVNKDLTNEGTTTIRNSTLNGRIINSGALIIEDGNTFGNSLMITGSGKVISNNINELFPYISEFTGETVIELGDYTKTISNSGNLTIENSTLTNNFVNYNNKNGNLKIKNSTLNIQISNSGTLELNNVTINNTITNTGTLILGDDIILGENFNLIGTGEVIANDMERFIDYVTTYTGNVALNNKTITTPKTNKGTLNINNCTINSTIRNDGKIIIDDDTVFGENAKITGIGEIVTNDITRILPIIDAINGNFVIHDMALNKSYVFNGQVTLNNCTTTSPNNTNFGTLYLNNCTVDVGEENKFIDNLGTLRISKDTQITGIINKLSGDVIDEGAPKTYIVNNNTVTYFFTNDGLTELVNPGDTLDFQGKISGVTELSSIIVNKPVNIISSTNDAYVELNTIGGSYFGDNPGYCFTVNKQGSYTNITGIYFHNTQLWLYNTDHVVLDNISAVVEDRRVGSGVGQTSIRANSSYITVKNSYFYTKNNGGSSTLVLAWANYCDIINNTIIGGGDNGNLLYLTTYNVEIPNGAIFNSFNRLINNTLIGPETPASICYGICLSGSGNLVDGNTITYSGEGIMAQWGSGVTGVESEESAYNSTDNVVSNNKLYGGCGISNGNQIYNNYMEGTLRVTNSKAYNNIANSLIVDGTQAEVYNNTIQGSTSISSNVKNALIIINNLYGNISIPSTATNITITQNNITGTITLDASANTITNNNITTDEEYTIESRRACTDNVITDNYLMAASNAGDDSVKLKDPSNVIENNIPINTVITIIAQNETTVNTTIPLTIILSTTKGNLLKDQEITVSTDTNETVTAKNGILIGLYTPASIGEKTITVTYNGFNDYLPITNNITVIATVDKDAIIEELNNTIQEANRECILTIDNIPDIKFNDNLTVYGKLMDTKGTGISGEKVTVNVNGVDSTVTTDVNGIWKLKVKTTTLGTNNVTATYSGTLYNPFTTSTTFEIAQTEAIITIDKIVTTQFRDNVTITGTFKNSNGKAIANSKVRVNVNGYSTYVTTDHDGVWSLTIKTNKTGVNNVTASFTGNANYAKYTANATFNVTKQDLVITTEVKYNKGNFTITGTFVDKNGNKLSNSKIRVNINGKAVYVKTDSNGTYTYSELVTAKTIKYNVYYGGSANYNSYTSSKTTLTVA